MRSYISALIVAFVSAEEQEDGFITGAYGYGAPHVYGPHPYGAPLYGHPGLHEEVHEEFGHPYAPYHGYGGFAYGPHPYDAPHPYAPHHPGFGFSPYGDYDAPIHHYADPYYGAHQLLYPVPKSEKKDAPKKKEAKKADEKKDAPKKKGQKANGIEVPENKEEEDNAYYYAHPYLAHGPHYAATRVDHYYDKDNEESEDNKMKMKMGFGMEVAKNEDDNYLVGRHYGYGHPYAYGAHPYYWGDKDNKSDDDN